LHWDGHGLGLGTVALALALALIVFGLGLGLECSGLVNITGTVERLSGRVSGLYDTTLEWCLKNSIHIHARFYKLWINLAMRMSHDLFLD